MRVVSWNVNQRDDCLLELAANESGFDVALLQEMRRPSGDLANRTIPVADRAWQTDGWQQRPFRTAIVQLTDRYPFSAVATAQIGSAGPDELAVSRPGTLTAATVELATGPVTLVSVYGAWEQPVPYTDNGWIYADASAHRIASDLSALIATQRHHAVIAAGDLNVLHGYGEGGSAYWAARYQTIFDRFRSLGLVFAGPQAPHGAPASPWPKELPDGSANVPTYRTHRSDPQTATRQLDFVFASESLGDRLTVRALNEPEEWGPSDHCRIHIALDE